jgi:uncharacterized SAM-binding protein YcdF (DUF218 family)
LTVDATPTSRRSFLRTVLLLALGALLGSVALVSFMAWQIAAQGARDERRPADAIVVLGAAQFNGRPSDVFQARLEHAVDLWKAGLAPYLVVTGGKVPDDLTTEAAVARAWAIARGVPAEAILAEDRGRTTLESLEAVALLFRENDLRSGVFVSDETHMLRVLRMASDLGMVAWGSPTRTSPSDRDEGRRRRSMLHELAGLAAYYVGGARLVGDSATLSSP